MTGVVYSVNACETSKPPTIEMPRGRRNSEPVPVPNASGSAPNRAAAVVIIMGRNRSMQASKIASEVLMPCSRSAIKAKSIIIMAFFLTMPISSTIPMIAITLRSVLVSSSAISAPTEAEGSVEMIVMGWTNLS